jgi:hypothetical protein
MSFVGGSMKPHGWIDELDDDGDEAHAWAGKLHSGGMRALSRDHEASWMRGLWFMGTTMSS